MTQSSTGTKPSVPKAPSPVQEWLYKDGGNVMMTGTQALVRLPAVHSTAAGQKKRT